MIEVLEFIADIVEALCCWRFFVCFLPVLFGVVALHRAFPNSIWPWFVSAPVVLVAVGCGIAWQRSRRKDS